MKKKQPAQSAVEPKKGLKYDHEDILEFLDQNARHTFTFKQLARQLNITTKDEKVELALVLQQLSDNGGLTMLGDGSFQSVKGQRIITGRCDFVNARFAWIVSPETEEDTKVQADHLLWAQDGDMVKVRLFNYKNRGGQEGEVVEILSRARTTFVGKLENRGRFAFVIPDNKRAHFDIFVAGEDTMDAPTGHKVIVQIVDWGNAERNPVGVVTDILGAAGENNTEMHAILAEFGLPSAFPPAVEAEAEAISGTIPASEIAKRRDMRKVLTFTIDPVDAKDFDDALSFEELPNGNFSIGIHIADVTYYIKPNTELEREAYSRATSVYLVDRVVPMLPEKLSNNLCSLVPHEDRLTFGAIFEIDPQGHIVDEWFGRTVIYSDHRFSYESAQEVLDNKEGLHLGPLTVLNELAHKLRDLRFQNGAIGFESPEVKFVLDERGKPLAVTPKVRKDTHKLVEEFMLLANKQVAEFVFNKRKGKLRNTMVYRIHEPPHQERVKIFAAFSKKFGYKLSLEPDQISASLNNFIEALQGKPEQDVLQNLAIRTMTKARYSTEVIGHFGLAFKHYSHFTSPIRRYPDMMAHRLLQHYLDGGEPVDAQAEEAKCKHSSDMEKRAADAERASIKYKQVEFMQLQNTSRTWDGIVSGVTEWGFYVEITETKCEGLVRISDLRDDFYELDSDNYRLIGQRTKRTINFGDKIEVRVKATNLEKRTIDLVLVDEDLERYKRAKNSPRSTKAKRYH